MRDYCETENCEFPATEELQVSISETEVAARSLCASCASAYHAGVQNGHLRSVRNLRRLGQQQAADAIGSLFYELNDASETPRSDD